MKRTTAVLLFVAAAAGAESDSQAASLATEAAKAYQTVDPLWARVVEDASKVTDEEIDALHAAYDKAMQLFADALEIEGNPSAQATQAIVARRLGKVSMIRMARSLAKRRAAAPAPPPEAPPENPADDDAPDDAPQPPENSPAREPEPESRRSPDAGPSLPEIEEDKESRRRGEQSLRDFILGHGANRRFEKLVTRCAVCNGRGKVVVGVDPKTRRPATRDCAKCLASGAHLNVRPARRAFWLCHSPLYRSDAGNQNQFESRIQEWRKDPRKIPEFIRSVRIVEHDYHGLWARAKYVEKGYATDTNRAFERQVQAMFLRLGRDWYFFDERFDDGLLTGKGAE